MRDMDTTCLTSLGFADLSRPLVVQARDPNTLLHGSRPSVSIASSALIAAKRTPCKPLKAV